MTNYEKTKLDERNKKYGIPDGKLQLQREPNKIGSVSDNSEFKHYAARKKEREDRWGMKNLALKGELGRRIEYTLEDAIRDNDKRRRLDNGFKLATASVEYNGQTVKIWFEIGK